VSVCPITTLAAVLRSGRTAPALALAGAALLLGACGSDDEGGTIPAENANAMLGQVDRVEANVEDGNCSLAAGAVSQLRDQVDALPAETGAETKGELFRLVDNLGELVDDPDQCNEPDTGATGETSVPTTPTTTTSSTTTTTTSTPPPEEEQEEAPPEQPPGEGNGAPGPGGNDSGGGDTGGLEG
jgi:hypothetical protein